PGLRKSAECFADPSNKFKASERIAPAICASHREDDAELGFAADHAGVGFLYFGKRKSFDHGADAGEFREAHGLFGIRSGSRGPALNGFASSDHEHSRNLERVAAGADNQDRKSVV